MRWEMEVEEIEAVLEKIWDLHDKLSDAIHSITRAHFLNSIKSQNRKSQSQSNDDLFLPKKIAPDVAATNSDNNRAGFVYFKDFSVALVTDDTSALQEAKSLNAIRTALENLEDQLEFFHTVQTQQRAERDAAIARLEQSRMVLAMRLAEHPGKNYKVIEEAQALVGDVRNASHFVSPDNLYVPLASPGEEKSLPRKGKSSNAFFNVFVSSFNFVKDSLKLGSNAFFNVFVSSFNFVKDSLKLDCVGGILGNAALVALSMLALMHLHQVGIKEKYILELPSRQEDVLYKRNTTKVSRPEGSSSGGRSSRLDVLLARG